MQLKGKVLWVGCAVLVLSNNLPAKENTKFGEVAAAAALDCSAVACEGNGLLWVVSKQTLSWCHDLVVTVRGYASEQAVVVLVLVRDGDSDLGWIEAFLARNRITATIIVDEEGSAFVGDSLIAGHIYVMDNGRLRTWSVEQ